MTAHVADREATVVFYFHFFFCTKPDNATVLNVHYLYQKKTLMCYSRFNYYNLKCLKVVLFCSFFSSFFIFIKLERCFSQVEGYLYLKGG